MLSTFSNRRVATWFIPLFVVTLAFSSISPHDASRAQDPKPELKSPAAKKQEPPIAEFEKYLSGSTLSGVFTIDGKPLNALEEERYEIQSAKKLEGDDNLWEIKTRIKYGNKDLTVPVVVTMGWQNADDRSRFNHHPRLGDFLGSRGLSRSKIRGNLETRQRRRTPLRTR